MFFFIACLGLLATQRHCLIAKVARSPWWSCGICPLAYLSNRRQGFSTELHRTTGGRLGFLKVELSVLSALAAGFVGTG